MPLEHVSFLTRPQLDRPSLICAFRGWNDGGEAATTAARYLAESWRARPIGYLDPEEFFDFQVTRPTVRMEAGVSRVIEWPRGEFAAASPEGHDVVVFISGEPNVRWRTFAGEIIGAAKELDVGLLATLGGFLADVPHRRPVPVVGSAHTEETAASLGLSHSQYEGPTGITGVLHDAANRAGLPSVSLWAAVSHYLPGTPNPKAALALARRASALLEVPVDTAPLEHAVQEWEHEVDQVLSENEELAEYVRRLEAIADTSFSSGGADQRSSLAGEPVPSGESIAAELERYLREHGGS